MTRQLLTFGVTSFYAYNILQNVVTGKHQRELSLRNYAECRRLMMRGVYFCYTMLGTQRQNISRRATGREPDEPTDQTSQNHRTLVMHFSPLL